MNQIKGEIVGAESTTDGCVVLKIKIRGERIPPTGTVIEIATEAE